MRTLMTIHLIALLSHSQGALALSETNWKCAYQSPGNSALITTLFSQSGDTLVGILDEYGGKQTRFKVLENSIAGLVAVSDKSSSTDLGGLRVNLTVVVLNKKSGAFEMTGYVIGTGYKDSYRGKCVKRNG